MNCSWQQIFKKKCLPTYFLLNIMIVSFLFYQSNFVFLIKPKCFIKFLYLIVLISLQYPLILYQFIRLCKFWLNFPLSPIGSLHINIFNILNSQYCYYLLMKSILGLQLIKNYPVFFLKKFYIKFNALLYLVVRFNWHYRSNHFILFAFK